MAFKVNPIIFRLGISRICRTVNNIGLTNYAYLWAQYTRYEKLLFLFFYKHKFWIVSSKIMNLSPNLILIFCNYYRLRLYFNDKPVRKKKRLLVDPDSQDRLMSWKKYFRKIFLKNKFIRCIKDGCIKKDFLELKNIFFFNKQLKKKRHSLWLQGKLWGFANRKYKKKKILKFRVYSRNFKNPLKLNKVGLSPYSRYSEFDSSLINNNRLKEKYFIDGTTSFLQIFYIKERIFFFYLQKNLKYFFNNKNIILKLRDIHNLLPFCEYKWEDALRTSYLVEIKRKHFIRTIFRDFVFMHRIAYLEMDAQLFTKIIINLFQMTKFHRRLIFLIKAVISVLTGFYKHIICKIKLKGKMQYRKRTKKVYLFKQTLPLNELTSVVEYGQGPAVTPFGVLGVKIWMYFINRKNKKIYKW